MKYHIAVVLILALSTSAAGQDKPIHKEPSFIFHSTMTGLEILTSNHYIDGKRFKEGNPILRRADGTYNLPAGIAFNLAETGAVAWYHKRSPKRARIVMWVLGGVKAAIVARTMILAR